MKSALKLLQFIYRTAMLKLSHTSSNPTSDYDNAATTYDDYYTKYLGKKALTMFEKLPIKQGQNLADLACGTGFFTHRMAEKTGISGTIVAVDISSGMLQRNQDKAVIKNLSNINFIQSDVLSFLQSLLSNSLDGIVIGWAICYMDHKKLRQELERVVKPGGFVGLIENRSCTLKDVLELFTKALIDYPEAMVKNMNLHLPKDSNYLAKAFCKKNLKVRESWDDFVIVPCENGDEIVDYIINSGASAGFIDALDKSMISKVFQKLGEYANQRFAKGDEVLVKHDFSVLIAEKIR